MLASTHVKTAALRPVSTAVEPRKSSLPGTANSAWSRGTRYTLRIPIVASEISVSSRHTLRQVDAVLFLPSNSYRSVDDLEQEVCNSVFGALYQQGERTNFAMYAEVEAVCPFGFSGGSQDGDASLGRRRVVLGEHNWMEILDMILSGESKDIELRANWWKSKKPGQVSKNILTGQTPSSFPMRRSMDQVSGGQSSPDKGKSISPRRSETGSSRGSRADRSESPKSRADSGQHLVSPK